MDLKAGAEQITGKHIYKDYGWIYVCLINALTLLLNSYLLDKLIEIGNIKYDILLHDYLWSRTQNSQTYRNTYDIIYSVGPYIYI